MGALVDGHCLKMEIRMEEEIMEIRATVTKDKAKAIVDSFKAEVEEGKGVVVGKLSMLMLKSNPLDDRIYHVNSFSAHCQYA